LFFCFLPSVLAASGFEMLENDVALTPAEMAALTDNRVVEFYEGGQSRYSVGGSYSYTYQGGGTAFGRFRVQDGGVICIEFNNGRSRCDQFVYSHGRLVMITESGDRFPVRPW
jgi:hypothetical protein